MKKMVSVFVSLLSSIIVEAKGQNSLSEICHEGVWSQNDKRHRVTVEQIPKKLLVAHSVRYQVKSPDMNYVSVQDFSQSSSNKRQKVISCGEEKKLTSKNMTYSLRVPTLLDFSSLDNKANSLWQFQLSFKDKEVRSRHHVVRLLSNSPADKILSQTSGEHEFYYNEDTHKYELFVKKKKTEGTNVEQFLVVEFESVRPFRKAFFSAK